MFADSLKFSEKFEIAHTEVLRKIKNLTMENPTVKNSFIEDIYVNERKRKYPRYLMDRSGYMFLVMNVSNKKANEIKWKFIEAFNKMEKALLNQQNASWIESRQLGKEERKELTGAVKDFIEYAEEQGNTKARFYYATITKMTYKALELLDNNKTTPIRDFITGLETRNLILAEKKVKESIKKGMDKKLDYREIYMLAKNELIEMINFLPKREIKENKQLN